MRIWPSATESLPRGEMPSSGSAFQTPAGSQPSPSKLELQIATGVAYAVPAIANTTTREIRIKDSLAFIASFLVLMKFKPYGRPSRVGDGNGTAFPRLSQERQYDRRPDAGFPFGSFLRALFSGDSLAALATTATLREQHSLNLPRSALPSFRMLRPQAEGCGKLMFTGYDVFPDFRRQA